MPSVYEKLRARLDMFPQGFPKTGSGVELEILAHLFSADEALIAASLGAFPELSPAIARRLGRDEDELTDTLYKMSRKGLIGRYKESDGRVYYFLAPWMIGIWEFQLNRLTPENIRLYEKFYRKAMVPSFKANLADSFRVIPIERQIQDDCEIQPYEKISAIIESQSRFAVADCICRKEARMMGAGCDKLRESCLSFGPAADFYIENELGREISKQEAYAVLHLAEKDGLVHFSMNHADGKIFICNCCRCCCKALANLTQYENPAFIAKSNYYASVADERCDGCELCTGRCQVEAIQIKADIAAIDTQKCIGCGLCASTCPNEAISMQRKAPDRLSHIFVNDLELLQARAGETNKTFPFV